MSAKKYFCLFLIILLIGTFFRLYRLTSFPPGLMQDEAVAGYDAFSLLQTGRDHHGVFLPVTFNSFNDWVSPFFIYYLVPFVKIFGLSAFSLRFSVAVLNILSAVLFYLVAKEFFKDKLSGLVAFFLISLSAYAISTARWAIPTHTIILPLLLFLLFFAKGLNQEKNRIINLVLAQFFLGIAVYTDTAMKLFCPILAVFTIILLRKTIRLKYSYIFILFMVFSLVSSLTYIDHLLHLSALNNRFNMISIFSLSSFWPLTYFINYVSYLLPFGLFLPGEVNPIRAIPGFGYEHLIYGLFFYGGLFALIKKMLIKEINTREKFILAYYFLSPLPTSFTLPGADFQRTLYILPALILISTEGFSFLTNQLPVYIEKTLSYPPAFTRKAITLIFVLLVFVNTGVFTSSYFGEKYNRIEKYYFQYGLKDVFSYVLRNEYKYSQINISDIINMPYIYYLFYAKYDPDKLNYEDFKNVDKNGWTKVDKIGKYHFSLIRESRLKDARLVRIIKNSAVLNYEIREKDKELFVILAKPSTSEVEHGYTSGSL